MVSQVNLAGIFQPLTAAQFLVDYFGAAPVHVPGAADRFAFLESAHRNLAQANSAHTNPGHTNPAHTSPAQANPARPNPACSCGACAVCSPALGLALSLERDFEAPVHAERVENVDAAEPVRGERDAIVVQAAGETEWKVYGQEKAQASDEPTWSALLEPGGALYLPRGHWRSASPRDSHTVSWFFHIHNPTGAELLQWLTDKMKEHELFQADIPRFASPATQAAYLTKLRKTFGWSFRTPSLLEAYARRTARLAPLHPVRGTAWSECLPADHAIALTAPRNPRLFRADPETVYLTVEGKELFFPADAVPLLQYLLDKAPVEIAAFYRQFEGEFDREELVSFLKALSRDGVIAMLAPELAN